MSFFDMQARNVHQLPVDRPKLGPGVYFSQQAKNHKVSYAPFGSLSSKKNKAGGVKTIGPGQYTINKQIVSPSVSKYQNKNIIIVKINDDGGHQFKSRTNRFKQLQQSTIGPGSYQTLVPDRKTRSTSIQRPKIVDKIRQINHQFYKKNIEVTLKSDSHLTVPQQTQTKTPKPKGTLSWGLNKRQRFSTQVKQEYTTEEREEALSELKANKNKRVHPSAVFASKSMKSHLETQIYGTNNSFKAELRKAINYKNQLPGPGTYDVHKKMADDTPSMFQFFGSTVERFPGQREEEAIGPGTYKIQEQSPSKKQRVIIYQKPDRQQRHSYLPNNTQIPGPGSYQVPVCIVRPSTSSKQFDKAFGSCQSRFRAKRQQQAQRQGDYTFQTTFYYRQKLQKRQQELNLRKKMMQQHASSAFVSNTKRFNQKNQNTVEIGNYDISQEHIGTRLSRYQKMAKQLQQCHLYKPPFQSSNVRFKDDKVEENNHKDCWCLIKSVEKQMISHQSPAFASEGKRDLFQKKSKVPPVGHYSNNKESMVKGSFNSRFRKKSEVQIKRNNAMQNRGAKLVSGNNGFARPNEVRMG